MTPTAQAATTHGRILLLFVGAPQNGYLSCPQGKFETRTDHSPQATNGPFGDTPIEWWPDDFHAIAHATSKGIIVIGPAGNGSQNLDHPIYSNPMPDFPAGWTNPLVAGGPDSGAIMVGAGNPHWVPTVEIKMASGTKRTLIERAAPSPNFGSRLTVKNGVLR